ncbi:hypothetical protein RJT34_03364 [Clitoria ternatea]|uniref:Uncharacterized protein n=1 Tax=Clitoria ternatea TaxID=43366 RepID=A0AAN9KK47_CLITE
MFGFNHHVQQPPMIFLWSLHHCKAMELEEPTNQPCPSIKFHLTPLLLSSSCLLFPRKGNHNPTSIRDDGIDLQAAIQRLYPSLSEKPPVKKEAANATEKVLYLGVPNIQVDIKLQTSLLAKKLEDLFPGVYHHINRVALRMLGLCLGKQAKVANSNFERSHLQPKALQSLEKEINWNQTMLI